MCSTQLKSNIIPSKGHVYAEGHLYMKLDIILVKKIHVMGCFIRTRQCTRVHRLGVQKRGKLKKKSVFLVILTNFEKDMTDK